MDKIQAHPGLITALAYAEHAHEGQTRTNMDGTKSPYVTHPISVAQRLWDFGVKDVRTLQVALLHDTVEDCAQKLFPHAQDDENARKFMLAQMQILFSRDLSESVSFLTNPLTVDNSTLTREERNRVYQLHVVEEINKNPRTLLVKASDFLDNAGSLDRALVHPSKLAWATRLAGKYRPLPTEFLSAFDKFDDRQFEHLDLSPFREAFVKMDEKLAEFA